MIGEAQRPAWLETRVILAAFGETESTAVEHYARFVAEGKGQPSPLGTPQESGVPRLRLVRGIHAATGSAKPRSTRGATGQGMSSRQSIICVCARAPSTQRHHYRRLSKWQIYPTGNRKLLQPPPEDSAQHEGKVTPNPDQREDLTPDLGNIGLPYRSNSSPNTSLPSTTGKVNALPQ